MRQSRRLNLLLLVTIVCFVVGIETVLQRAEPPRWALPQELTSPPQPMPSSQTVSVFKPTAGLSDWETRINVALEVGDAGPVHPKVYLKIRSLPSGSVLYANDIESPVRRSVHELGGRVSFLIGGHEANVWVEDLPADVALHDLLTTIEERCGYHVVAEQDDRY